MTSNKYPTGHKKIIKETKRRIWYFLTEGEEGFSETQITCRVMMSDICKHCQEIKRRLDLIIESEMQKSREDERQKWFLKLAKTFGNEKKILEVLNRMIDEDMSAGNNLKVTRGRGNKNDK